MLTTTAFGCSLKHEMILRRNGSYTGVFIGYLSMVRLHRLLPELHLDGLLLWDRCPFGGRSPSTPERPWKMLYIFFKEPRWSDSWQTWLCIPSVWVSFRSLQHHQTDETLGCSIRKTFFCLDLCDARTRRIYACASRDQPSFCCLPERPHARARHPKMLSRQLNSS